MLEILKVMRRGGLKRATFYAGLAFSAALIAEAGAAVDAAAQSTASLTSPSGQWDMALEDTNRKCRIFLRDEAAPVSGAQVVAMPAGCRRAMPILSNVFIWSREGGSFALGARDGAEVLRFDVASNGALQAKGPEGETYTLTASDAAARQVAQAAAPTTPGFQPVAVPSPSTGAVSSPATAVAASPSTGAVPSPSTGAVPSPSTGAAPSPSTAATPSPSVVAQAKPVVLDPPKPAALPGRYAVLRDGGKDTGCMLTLDDKARGPKGTNKAQLAPACRDQGVVIFDPAGWTLEKGKLVLTARKGHHASFDRTAEGVWMKEGKEGKPLGFRKM